jgi:hypothetical protein
VDDRNPARQITILKSGNELGRLGFRCRLSTDNRRLMQLGGMSLQLLAGMHIDVRWHVAPTAIERASGLRLGVRSMSLGALFEMSPGMRWGCPLTDQPASL